jgi:hypothetical protein
MTTPSADGWSLFEMRGRRLKVVGADIGGLLSLEQMPPI